MLWMGCPLALAQTPEPIVSPTSEIKLFAPQLTISADGTSASDIEEQPGEDFKTSRVAFSGSFPLTGQIVSQQPQVDLFQLFGQVRLASTKVSYSPLGEDRQLYKGSIGLIGAKYRLGGDFILAAVGTSIAEDEHTIDSPILQYYGFGLYGWVWKDKGFVMTGAGYFNVFGRDLLLPLLGLIYRPDSNWTIVTILPVLFKATRKINRSWSVAGLVQAVGEQSYFANRDKFRGFDEQLIYRENSGRVAAEGVWKIQKGWQFKGQLGMVGRRKLKILDGKEEVLDVTVEPGAFVMLSTTFALDSSLMDQTGIGF